MTDLEVMWVYWFVQLGFLLFLPSSHEGAY